MKEKYIKIGEFEYRIILYDDKEIVFSRLDDNASSFDFESNEITHITNDTRNPLKVMRKIVNEVISMVYENNLTYFRVRALEDKRGIVYKKLFENIIQKRNLKFKFYVYEGYFIFYD